MINEGGIRYRIKNRINQFGLKKGTERAFKRLFSKIFYIETKMLYVKDLETDITPITPKLNDLTVRIISKNDWANKKTLVGKKKLSIFNDRYQDGGYVCFGAFRDNQLVYFSWLSMDKFPEDNGFNLDFPNNFGYGYLFDDYTFPDSRGMGIHMYVLYKRLLFLVENNCKFAYIIVIKDNIAAKKTLQRLGFQLSQRINIITVFNKYKLIKNNTNN